MQNEFVEDAPFIHIEGDDLKESDLSSGTYRKPVTNIVLARIPKKVWNYFDDAAVSVIKSYRAADKKVEQIFDGEIAGGPLGRMMSALGRDFEVNKQPGMGR